MNKVKICSYPLTIIFVTCSSICFDLLTVIGFLFCIKCIILLWVRLILVELAGLTTLVLGTFDVLTGEPTHLFI